MDFPALYVDTETTDFHSREQRALPVQIAFILATEDRVIFTSAQIISQTQWVNIPYNTITQRVIDKHGITNAVCEVYGMPPDTVLHSLRSALQQAVLVVGHNIEFDLSVIDNALNQQRLPVINWPKSFCTMRESAAYVGIPAWGIRAIDGFKAPKLGEAYRYFAGKERTISHDALADVYACRYIHRAIVQRRSNQQ